MKIENRGEIIYRGQKPEDKGITIHKVLDGYDVRLNGVIESSHYSLDSALYSIGFPIDRGYGHLPIGHHNRYNADEFNN